jgi:short-subunit dehydrogenase involved in D-alanine esterification of teichoic acids
LKPTGNTILITGGTSGIGLGLAQRFLGAGNTVIVAGRRAEQLEKAAAAHPGLKTLQLDVTAPASIARARETVTSDFPELNVLINNAGIQLPEHLLDGDWLGVAENTVATNLLGPIRVIEAFLPHLVSREHAVIINTSSGLASVPLPITPTYNATKAAIASFTESLRVQLADTSVQVIELVPPAVHTTLMGQQDLETAMPLEDFLDEATELLRTQPDAGAIVVGFATALRNAKVDGTYDQFLATFSNYAA